MHSVRWGGILACVFSSSCGRLSHRAESTTQGSLSLPAADRIYPHLLVSQPFTPNAPTPIVTFSPPIR